MLPQPTGPCISPILIIATLNITALDTMCPTPFIGNAFIIQTVQNTGAVPRLVTLITIGGAIITGDNCHNIQQLASIDQLVA